MAFRGSCGLCFCWNGQTPMTTSEKKSELLPGFANLGLDPRLLGTLSALGYEEPTPIQAVAILSIWSIWRPAINPTNSTTVADPRGSSSTTASSLSVQQQSASSMPEPATPVAEAAQTSSQTAPPVPAQSPTPATGPDRTITGTTAGQPSRPLKRSQSPTSRSAWYGRSSGPPAFCS